MKYLDFSGSGMFGNIRQRFLTNMKQRQCLVLSEIIQIIGISAQGGFAERVGSVFRDQSF